MMRKLIAVIIRFLPAGLISRAWGVVVRWQRPRFFVALAKRLFVRFTGIDLAEAEKSIEEYISIEDLFVRYLKTNARSIDVAADAIISPVDGIIGMCGLVLQGTLLQVKGRSYSLAQLLNDEREAARFEGGAYATIYLSPKDYHRIHAPIAGAVHNATVIPGRLLPVFSEVIERIEDLFARNERVVTYIDTETSGCVALVKVGATMVGRIGVTYDLTIRTNTTRAYIRRIEYPEPYVLQKGDEVGVFELGSTVILITEPGRISFDAIAPLQSVQMGLRIGTIH
ncbi:MAG: phosphatidylserine decarboxylase [Deltaproteobacteria bacterium]|nr:phosphatidylserine decarboxylase [Deltaproteobacteria bacterium]